MEKNQSTKLPIVLLLTACTSTQTQPPPQQQISKPGGPRETAEPAESAKPPRRATVSQAIFRPTFTTVSFGQFSAGTAFLVEHNNTKLLLTAHHLFGPAGGLPRDLSWHEFPTELTRVDGISPFHEGLSVFSGRPIQIEGAVGISESSLNADLAAFQIDAESSLVTLRLSGTLPKVGAKVILLAEVIGSKESRHPAVVMQSGKDAIYYVFESPIELRATSGAPVINANNEVVAINLGGGENNGAVFGAGPPASALRPLLTRALR